MSKKYFSSRTSALLLGVAFGASTLVGGISFAQSLSIPSNLENAIIAIKEIYLSEHGTSTTRSAWGQGGDLGGDRATIHFNGADGNIKSAGNFTLEWMADLQKKVTVGQTLKLSDYACSPSTGPEIGQQAGTFQETCILITDDEGTVIKTWFIQTIDNNSEIINEILWLWKKTNSSNSGDIFLGNPDNTTANNVLVRVGIKPEGSASTTDAQLIVRHPIQSREAFSILRQPWLAVGNPNDGLLPSDGIGTTLAESKITQTTDGQKMIIQHRASGGGAGSIILKWKQTSPVSVGINTDTPTATLDINGDIKATTYLYRSDARYKNSIKPLSNALDSIRALQWYSYHNILTDKSDIGVIAQNIETVFPELVHTDETGYKSVEYANLVAPLIEAVKELATQVDTQQSQIDALYTRLEALEARN